MLYTNNFKLKKPENDDMYDIRDFNENADMIDAELQKRPTEIGKASEMTAEFEQASSRINLVSGESLKVSFGKLMKWLADLKTGAFASVANNDTTTAGGYVADARMMKVHGDEIDKLNTDFRAHKSGTDHDGRYYTEAEIDGKIAALNSDVAGKSQKNHVHDDRYHTSAIVDSKISTVSNYSGQTGTWGNNSWINGSETSIDAVVNSLPVGATRLYMYLPSASDRNGGLMSSEWGHAKVINNGAYAEIEYTALSSNKKFLKYKCDSWNQNWHPYSGYNTPRANGIISDVLLLSNNDGSKNNQTFLYNKNQSINCPPGAEFGFRVVMMTSDVAHNGTLNAMVILYDMNSNIYMNTIQGGPWLGWRKFSSTPV